MRRTFVVPCPVVLALALFIMSGCGGESPMMNGTGDDLAGAGDLGAGADLLPPPDMADPCITVRCSAGFMCQAGQCVPTPGTQWVLTLTSGQISALAPDNSAWDPLGGAPDAYVCLTYLGSRRCSATRDDTLAPSWNEAFPAAPANNLLGGILFEMWDKDVIDPDDAICAAEVIPLAASDLLAGTWSASCARGSIKATLQRQ